MFGRRHKFITHLGSLLHQKIWPAQSFHSFPPFMSYLRPRGVKFFLPLVDESCPIRVWLKKIHMMDWGLTHTTLDQKPLEQKVWSPIACTWALHFWIYRVSSFSVGWDHASPLRLYTPFPMKLKRSWAKCPTSCLRKRESWVGGWVGIHKMDPPFLLWLGWRLHSLP